MAVLPEGESSGGLSWASDVLLAPAAEAGDGGIPATPTVRLPSYRARVEGLQTVTAASPTEWDDALDLLAREALTAGRPGDK